MSPGSQGWGTWEPPGRAARAVKGLLRGPGERKVTGRGPGRARDDK